MNGLSFFRASFQCIVRTSLKETVKAGGWKADAISEVRITLTEVYLSKSITVDGQLKENV